MESGRSIMQLYYLTKLINLAVAVNCARNIVNFVTSKTLARNIVPQVFIGLRKECGFRVYLTKVDLSFILYTV